MESDIKSTFTFLRSVLGGSDEVLTPKIMHIVKKEQNFCGQSDKKSTLIWNKKSTVISNKKKYSDLEQKKYSSMGQ